MDCGILSIIEDKNVCKTFSSTIWDTMCVVIIRQMEGENKYFRNVRHWCEDCSMKNGNKICFFFCLRGGYN